jgi:PTH1 family peptidyl-tRNA hydrolase
MYLVAGLGNIGDKYAYTWHNLGFLAVEMLADKHGITLDKSKFNGVYGKGKIGGEDVIILKPSTFMNNSGQSVAPCASFFKIEPSHIIVVYDDIDIAKGTIRVREKGSAGTHNGMRSCIQHLGTELFPRVRIGTGPVPEHFELINYVLTDVPKDERVMMNDAFVKACEAIEKMVEDGKKS